MESDDTELAVVLTEVAWAEADRVWRRYTLWVASFVLVAATWTISAIALVLNMVLEEWQTAAAWTVMFVVTTLAGIGCTWRTEVARRAWTKAEEWK